ncbi:MAG: aromatic hydrocarbon degradation protein [Kordia sp.]|nr:MAG: aromatic hydrocarbon degradation protein [Kordia sp.]
MKKIVLIISLIASVGFAQNINDAILFSGENIQGTARYNAMSGAFGALGGDFSSINNNPASSAVFKNSLLTGTLGVSWSKNNAEYLGTKTYESNSGIGINQLGGAFVLNNVKEDSNWKKLVIAINYNQVQNFDKEYYISGKSDTSVSSYFLSQANGLQFQDLQILSGEYIEEAYLNILEAYGYQHQQAFLGYYGGVIDPVDVSDLANTSYIGTGSYTTVNQDYYYSNRGANSKFNFNIATQYKDVLYLGVALNGNFINTERFTSIRETGYDASSQLEFVTFDNKLKTTGAGFSMQVGAIGKIGKMLRLGASFHSPTWYVLNDEQSQKINSNLADIDISFIGENQVTIFEDYKLRTPAKLTGSVAVIFGKHGLLSLDYHYKDYNNIKLRSDSGFADTNRNISTSLAGTSSFNLGGEYRIQNWSMRAGYRFEESPYKNKVLMDNLTGYSLGFGYNFGRSKLDFSYNQTNQKRSHQLYDIGLTNAAKIDERNGAITTSFTLIL